MTDATLAAQKGVTTSQEKPPLGLETESIEAVNDETGQMVLSELRHAIPTLARGPVEDLEAKRNQLEGLDTLTEEGVEQHLEEYAQKRAETWLPDRGVDDLPGGGLPKMRHRLNNVKRNAYQTLEQAPEIVPEPEDRTDAFAAADERRMREKIEAADSPFEVAQKLVESGNPTAIRAALRWPEGAPYNPPDEKTLRERAAEVRLPEEALEAREDLEKYERADDALDRLERHLRSTLGVEGDSG